MTRRTVALTLCLLATAATPALAQSPVEAGYGETPVPPMPTCTTPSAGTPSSGPSSSTGTGSGCETTPPAPSCTGSAGGPSSSAPGAPGSSTGSACQTTPTPPAPQPSCTSGTNGTNGTGTNGSGANGSCDENAVAGQQRSQPANDSQVAGASDTQAARKHSDPKRAAAPSQVAGAQDDKTAPVATKTVDSSGSLPFTGMDSGVIALMAAVLLGVGFVLRRATAPARD